MDAVNIGPLALPLRALVPLLGLGAANLVAWWWQRRRGLDAGTPLWRMTVWGLLAARAAFVLKHFDAYMAEPLQILNLRDGGFVAFAGLLVALAIGMDAVRRQAGLRRPLASATLAGLLVWTGATLGLHAIQDARQPLPVLTLRQLDGSPAELRTLAKGPAAVNLWASWCGPCRREMPVLGAAQAAHPDIAFVFVNQGEDAQAVRSYLAGEAPRLGRGLSNVVLDPTGRLARETGVKGYPTTLFFDARGRLAGRHLGELTAVQLRERLDSLRRR